MLDTLTVKRKPGTLHAVGYVLWAQSLLHAGCCPALWLLWGAPVDAGFDPCLGHGSFGGSSRTLWEWILHCIWGGLLSYAILGAKGWIVLYKCTAPLGCPQNRMLADLVSVQCAAIGLCCSEEFKKSKTKPLLAQLFIFSIFWRLAHPYISLFIRRHYSPSSLIGKSIQYVPS